ncbi:unnamed protein product [Cyprideis torosa]|uniref:Uncharacterized protein n=1 Tax=Cyprideis torosa TaxID=163714 RepID=A0A7R8ZP57_9CRUS|nr:unnamed protein product [Cyprideis torosa]CAG0893128.1 unnamed protein product [Cyprideis torosa]
MPNSKPPPVIAVILPFHNADKWLEECLRSIFLQECSVGVSVSGFDDASDDESVAVFQRLSNEAPSSISMVLGRNRSGGPLGVGASRNAAVRQCQGDYLCFQDADDVMLPGRLEKQWRVATSNHGLLVGAQVTRIPTDATPRYTKWCNQLSPKQLYSQIFTSNGPTLLMPTWFCHRDVFDRVGGFHESPPQAGFPEDLAFFYEHLQHGGQLHRVDEELVCYRHHNSAMTMSVKAETIRKLSLAAMIDRVLKNWETFIIWNAGKGGRRFYRSLPDVIREKVIAFCDVDRKKIDKGYYTFEESPNVPKPRVPVIHFRDASPPFVICVKLDLTHGAFEQNLNSLDLKEGEDYHFFS